MQATTAKTTPEALSEGMQAPDFDLAADGGGRVSLAGLRGKKVVIYFYPKDDTPGCTIEAKDFRDHIKDFAAAGAEVLGVSRDSVQSHDKFKEKFCLPFKLVSDEGGEMCEAYGVWVQKSMYGKTYMGIDRTTFLVDKQGVISKIWRKVKVDGHVQDVLKAVQELK